MNVIIDEAQKIAELWVPMGTREETVCAGIREYSNAYRVVVYRSGSRDLTAATQSLLMANA